MWESTGHESWHAGTCFADGKPARMGEIQPRLQVQYVKLCVPALRLCLIE